MADRPASTTHFSSAIMILLALTAANVMGYAARNALFSAYADLRVRFLVDDADLGLLTTAFMAGQALVTVPVGWAGDRFGRKPVLVAGVALAGLAGCFGAFSTGAAMLAATRALVGIGCASIVPIANSILSQLFDGPKKASRIAVFNVGMFVGGGLGFAGGASPGYPWVLLIIGVPTLGVALVISRLRIPVAAAVDNASPTITMARVGAEIPKLSGKQPLRPLRYVWTAVVEAAQGAARVLRLPAVPWLVASATVMAFAAGGLQSWLVEFLKREKHMTEGQANGLLITAMFGALAGVVVGARVGDRWRARARAGLAKTIALALALAAPMLALCIVIPPGPGLSIAAVIGMFFLSWYHAPLAATVDDLVPAEQSVTAQAVVVFAMHLLGTAPASWVVGLMSKRHNLTSAMWLPVTSIAVAAVLMLITARVMRSVPLANQQRPMNDP